MTQLDTTLRKHILVRSLCTFLIALIFSITADGQIVVTANRTATQLATALVGVGVTISSPTLNCPGPANGTFVTTTVDPLGIPNGIVLTNGAAKDTTIGTLYYGVGDPSSTFANLPYNTPGDPDLTALSGDSTYDACVLEFDFNAVGDTIKFNYVFGSEEYTDYTCSPYNDVFGFFISGGAYTTRTNLALVPGTTIPVCINSVNCGATGSWPLSTCTSVGPGSPFCAYYVNNLTGPAAPYVTYDGLTTKLTAVAAVNPCITYHLKLGVADAGDSLLDSGVFIEGGSLSSNPPAILSAVGTTGLPLGADGNPYCIRGCNPGAFVFSIPTARDTNYTIRYLVTGTAVNGYDYTAIADTIVLPAFSTSVTLPIDPTLVPPAGPKVVTIKILIPNPCIPDSFTVGAIASITILDSFSFRIITPDTAICQGQHVDIVAMGDTLFGGALYYRWSPAGTLSTTTGLNPTATPFVTTTYVLRDSTAPILGCPTETRSITITVYPYPTLTTDSPLVKTCVGVPVNLHVNASPAGMPYTYSWSPPTDLSSTSIYNPVVDPTSPGDVIYTVSVGPSALRACSSTTTIDVHTEPNDFILGNPDTAICILQSVQTRVFGSPAFSWLWTPSSGVSNTTIMTPLITPTVTAVYTVIASYAHCPDMVHSFRIEVDSPAPPRIFTDTICLGMSDSVNFTAPDTQFIYHYTWTPVAGLNNDTIPNPVFTPTVVGTSVWNLVIQPNAAACASFGTVTLLVAPNSISIKPNDTAICKGKDIQVRGTAFPLFNYQWLPTAGIPMSNVLTPTISPDTSDIYIVTATFNKCPDMHDTLRVDVQPNPVLFAGGNRSVCQYDSIHIHASVEPAWYTHYSYKWTPSAGLDNDTMPTVVFTAADTAGTTFVLTVTTPAGCSAIDSDRIIIYPGNFAGKLPDLSFCPHDTATLFASGGVAYRWRPSLYLSDSESASPLIRPVTSQTYTLVATSIYGCRDTVTFHESVHPGALFFIGQDSVTLHPGETYQINPQTNCTYFAWTPPAGLNYPQIADPLASPEISTKYIVHAQTEYGCRTVDSIKIYVDPQTLLVLPNAFSPGTGPNSEFKIIKQGIATLNYFRIFNRWGNLVFETTDIDQGWNGEYNGVPQPFGVFVYEVEAVTSSGKVFKKHGNLTLIR